MAANEDRGRVETESPRCWFVELVFAGKRTWRRADQSRIRAALRDHGSQSHGASSVLLFGAGHRQYGSARPLWHAGTKRTVPQTAASRRNPVVLCHDRTG